MTFSDQVKADMRRAACIAIRAAVLMAGACGPAGAQPGLLAAATALENFRHADPTA